MLKKHIKKLISKTFKNQRVFPNGNIGIDKPDRYEFSIREESRRAYDADGESWVTYGIIPREQMREDPDTYFDAMMDDINREVWSRTYDCTGLPFVRFIDWKRLTSGDVSYKLHMALDI